MITRRLKINNSHRVYVTDPSGGKHTYDTPEPLSDTVAQQKADDELAIRLDEESETTDDGTYKVELVSKSGEKIIVDGRVTIKDMPDPGDVDIILDEIPVFVGKKSKKIKPVKVA